MNQPDAIVIGAGHNGLTCACYLARAGLDVLVLEQSGEVGGAAHMAETITGAPGYRFDTCSVVHNLINMTSIREELKLDEAGLEYIETDPFLVSLLPDGEVVRFYHSVERTCAEIACHSTHDAEAYAKFIDLADPIAEMALSTFRQSEDEWSAIGEGRYLLSSAWRLLWQTGPLHLARQLSGAYGALLKEWFRTEEARLGLVGLAAHGTLAPHTPDAAFFAFFQAAYHRYGNWPPGAAPARLRRPCAAGWRPGAVRCPRA